jgi:hypothetical protein
MRFKERGQERGRTTWFHVVACKACGEEWPSDPALQVACTACQARPGERCIWRGQHGYTHHLNRDRQAMRAGRLTGCGALTWDGRHSRHEVLVCTQRVPTYRSGFHSSPGRTARSVLSGEIQVWLLIAHFGPKSSLCVPRQGGMDVG